MLSSMCRKVLLGGACFAVGLLSWGQQSANKAQTPSVSIDAGINVAFERAYIAPGSCDCFWFQGGGADLGVTIWRGLGYALALSGDHASNVEPGIDVNKITYVFGPRYTFVPLAHKTHFKSAQRAQVFGEGLFGSTHAFNGSFPSTTGLHASADSFAMQIGGGIQIPIARKLMVRALEADYVRTSLPNNFSNDQNDLRLGVGLNYHVGLFLHQH